MANLIYIGIGGALGAIARYSLAGLAQKLGGAGFPWGTLTVNVLGCLAIGMLWAVHQRSSLSEATGAFLFVGILGSFTTFSTFSLDALQLFRDGATWLAIVYILASNILGLVAAFAGYVASNFLLGVSGGQ